MIERLEATVDHVLTCQTQALKIGRSLAPNHQYYRVGAPGLSGAPRRHAKKINIRHLHTENVLVFAWDSAWAEQWDPSTCCSWLPFR